MRKRVLMNDGWKFLKSADNLNSAIAQEGENISLPHTWNADDGQDGGNDYYRGSCWYVKEFELDSVPENKETWIEFRGVSLVGDVYLNGEHITTHKGGFSTFRVNLSENIKLKNTLVIKVDNSYRRDVYPQKADFTFYGGIYRDVYMIQLPEQHFDLDYFGSEGMKITTEVKGNSAVVHWEIWTKNVQDGKEINFQILNIGEKKCEIKNNYSSGSLTIENVRLWNGIEDPYLYEAKATLIENGDQISKKFGCRTFDMNPDKGFFLNGKSYPLCGVSRHQDRFGVGNALTKEMHDEDMKLIRELGANTIRLAHYQHDQYFYDLCDQEGIIVWAEIPYITEHMEEANENSYEQMKELVIQNYHHPSIVCWGLSNEITATSGVTDEIIKNHKRLNDLCHNLDPTRKTALAHAFMLDPNSEFTFLADVSSYNLYYGWYLGDLNMNNKWFDDLKESNPNEIIGFSEFGADANPQYQSPRPEKGDWTESYQAIFHEHILKLWKERPYLWAIHCWNMFDFGADGRNEGGKPGQNQKGLVTFDRKVKKDAFYVYKAYLSSEPFIHLCGKRYIERTEDQTEIKVYSNQDKVTLYVDGREIETKTSDKIFKFNISLTDSHEVIVSTGKLIDKMVIKKVSEVNEKYTVEGREVVNWFDQPNELLREGYYSVLDKISTIKQNEEAYKIYLSYLSMVKKDYGDVAKNIHMPEFLKIVQEESTVMNQLKQSNIMTMKLMKELNYKLNLIPKN